MEKVRTIYFNIALTVLLSLIAGQVVAQEGDTSIDITQIDEPPLSVTLYPDTPQPTLTSRQRINQAIHNTLESSDEVINEAIGIRALLSDDRIPDTKDSDNLANSPIKTATINILNKITTERVSQVIETGSIDHYGTLNIKLFDCVTSQPNEPKGVKALIEITENSPSDFVNMSLVGQELEVGKKIFFGWMIQSNPAISSLEHPIYDITVQGCGNI